MRPFLTLRRGELCLVPATLELARAELRGGAALADVLGAAQPPSWPPPLTEDTLDWSLRDLQSAPDLLLWAKWYILHGAAPDLVGMVAFKGRPTGREVEIGYSLLEPWHRRGIATRAVDLLLDWCSATGAVDKVCAHTLPELTASIRVLVKNGFLLIGPGLEPETIRYERSL